MEFQQVYMRYKPELDQVESLLLEAVGSRNPLLSQSSTQLLRAGGKRIRPLFALLCSRLGEGDRSKVTVLAAAMELIHMASLVHDDVIDDAALRRGKPTVRAQFGNRPAMYVGDFLFAKAIQMLSSLGQDKVHLVISDAMVRMSEGEIEQLRDFYNLRQSLRDYLRRVERKTALLIQISCAMGAFLVDAPEAIVSALRRFGRFTGMAFQIIDDVLDYSGDERVVGKRVGGDLLQGNLTLPALYAASCSQHGAKLQAIVRPEMTTEDVAEAVRLVQETGGIEFAKNLAKQYMDKAFTALESVQGHGAYDELSVVARFVNQRAY